MVDLNVYICMFDVIYEPSSCDLKVRRTHLQTRKREKAARKKNLKQLNVKR